MIDIKIEAAPVSSEPERRYPWIGVSEQGNIVIFSCPERGVCLESKKGNHSIGELRRDWNEPAFKEFKGSITISQGVEKKEESSGNLPEVEANAMEVGKKYLSRTKNNNIHCVRLNGDLLTDTSYGHSWTIEEARVLASKFYGPIEI